MLQKPYVLIYDLVVMLSMLAWWFEHAPYQTGHHKPWHTTWGSTVMIIIKRLKDSRLTSIYFTIIYIFANCI